MSDNHQAATSDELVAFLLPLANKNMVLPNVAITEVVPALGVNSKGGAADWMLGTMPWRDQNLPLISFESLNGDTVNAANIGKNVAVLNGTIEPKKMPFYGIMLQAPPRMLRLFQHDIAHLESAKTGHAEEMIVSIIGALAVIPNIEFIEQSILDSLAAQ